VPHDEGGNSLESRLIANSIDEEIAGIRFKFTLSRVPEGGRYRDFHEKIATYCCYLCPPAKAKDPNATPYRHNPVTTEDEAEEMFFYLDTNAARGHFVVDNERFRGHRMGIVGVGGTGSYVLDLVSKCQVAEIRLIDGDVFKDHNAFRAPGAASVEDLKAMRSKVSHWAEKYSKMHKNVRPVECYVDEQNVAQLDDLNFVFLCIDPSPDKKAIVRHLVEHQIPFIDAGVGVQRRDGNLAGQIRTTLVSNGTPPELVSRIPVVDDDAEDQYATNIQIAELNALAAVLAVMRWKRYIGFYDDLEREWQSIYVIDGNALMNTRDVDA